jgi:octaprenyl-diphosphate synthase
MLDYGGTTAVIGKNTGDDFRERKLTLPLIKAVAKASPEERAFWTRVIEKGDQREADLSQALMILQQHDAISACAADAMAWANRAKTALHNLPAHPLRDVLSELADFVVSRVS